MLAPSRRRLGSLSTLVLDPADSHAKVERVVVLCHGYGAPGDDLVPLAEEIQAQVGNRPIRYVFPAAPQSLDSLGIYGGRAWWPISIQSLLEEFEQGHHDVLRQFVPPGLSEAREALDLTIAAALDEVQLDRSRLVLGGFSQGAMLATETALHRGDAIAGLLLWSGTLISESQWRSQAAQTPPLKIVQSHGRFDPILPFVTATWLRDLLKESGHEVRWLEFNGPHTIPYEAIQASAQLLAE